MSALTGISVPSFFSELRDQSKIPRGKLKVSPAPQIVSESGFSPGKKTTRFCFEELGEERFKIAAREDGCCVPCGDYEEASVEINGRVEKIWVNVRSLMKRFDLPRPVIANQLMRLNNVVRLVKERQLFEVIRGEDGQEGPRVPLLPIGPPLPSLVPLETMVKIADEQSRCFRLSKWCYPQLAKSVDVWPNGWITIDTEKLLGRGRKGKVKLSFTPQGRKVARRSVKVDVHNPKDEQAVLRWVQVLNEFRGKPGILDTLAMGLYVNKWGQVKFISLHPLYDHVLSKAFKRQPSEQDRLQMAHQLLKGLAAVHEKGVHHDLSYRNLLVRSKDRFETVISDLEHFHTHEEGAYPTVNPLPGPEKDSGAKRDVWDIGNALYYLLQSRYRPLRWDRGFPRKKEEITQENLDKALQDMPEEALPLLKGMLDLNPQTRWTAQQALEYFEKYLASHAELPAFETCSDFPDEDFKT